MNCFFDKNAKKKEYDKRVLLLQTLGIIFVLLGHTGDSLQLFSGWFPYYTFHMPLFFFISGYLYNAKSEERVGHYIVHKILKIGIPFYCWLLVYGVIGELFIGNNLVLYGERMNLKNYFVYPWTLGCKYSFTAAWWYIPVFFVCELVNVVFRRIVLYRRKAHHEVILQFIYLILGAIAIEYSRRVGGKYGGDMPEILMLPIEVCFFLPFFQMGHIYKQYLGNKIDKIKPQYFYSAVMLIQGALLFHVTQTGGGVQRLHSCSLKFPIHMDYYIHWIDNSVIFLV